MSVLLQCPRCSRYHVRPRDQLGQRTTCSSCKFEFVAAEVLKQDAPVFAPIPGLALGEVPPSLVEAESVHEVEDIEVLDEPAPKAGPPPVPSLELGPPSTSSPAEQVVDQVEVIEPVPRRHESEPAPTMVDAEIVAEPVAPPPRHVPEPAPTIVDAEVVPEPAAPPPPSLDKVEVIPDVEAVPLPQETFAARSDTPVIATAEVTQQEHRETGPPPVRRKERERTIDIRKPSPRETRTPAGVWVGLGAGVFGLVALVVILVLALRSGGRGEAVVQPQPAPPPPAEKQPPVERYLPTKEEWPPPPDRRGPAPWQPTMPTFAREVPAADKLPDLVAYWPLDEGAGDQVADRSDKGHKGTLVGGWWINGVRGKALLFDGQRDYLDLGDGPSLNFPADGPFTIAGWMATKQPNGYVLAFRDPRESAPLIQLKLNGGAWGGVVRADGSAHGEARLGLTPAADARWHHFALMRHAGGAIECLLDGQSLGKQVGANTQGSITTILRTVGCERAWYLKQRNAAAYCACAIDELCVFSRALSRQEVVSLAGR